MMQSLRKRQLAGQVNGIDVTRIVPYPASRGYIFTVRVVVRKVPLPTTVQFSIVRASRFLDGFERLSTEATFCTTAHTAKM